MNRSILAIDQGTTSSRAFVFSLDGTILASSRYEIRQIYPGDGWVEHDPAMIWKTALQSTRDALQKAGSDVATVGIANQRETTLIWDRGTGEPVYNAIVWQDRRTAPACDRIRQDGHGREITARTGLIADAYFSATKIAWILDNVSGVRSRAERGELAFGTVDCFLVWKLTGGAVHATDATNASRTLLFNIHEQDWDDHLLSLFDVPKGLLPDVRDSADDYGITDSRILGVELPIRGVVGDQQGALFGQACFDPGMTKSTYGTGCFMIMNTGSEPVVSRNRLLTTVGYRLAGQVTYALEGSLFNAGTAIQWVRDNLKLIRHVREIDALIESTHDNGGVYMVPAFTGLGAPHWDPDARAAVVGITRDTGIAHLLRAALEAVCYQSRELIGAMEADSGRQLDRLRVDGGMAANDWMLQFLADILDTVVEKPTVIETTALGAAFLAGTGHGIFASIDEIASRWSRESLFTSDMGPGRRKALVDGWNDAVGRVKTR
ncbi:MAG: glycerol kinase GlpK [Gammaproteobacteria bacterium]|nr:glycerol kinase GlpK [Gammaproteobacteria bacterium]MYJ51271.1 glycerol kinase GlpK [Gammaproteobacteria bacterium]